MQQGPAKPVSSNWQDALRYDGRHVTPVPRQVLPVKEINHVLSEIRVQVLMQVRSVMGDSSSGRALDC